MRVTIGQLQLEELKRRNLSPEDLVSFIDQLLRELPESSEFYEALKELRFHYATITRYTYLQLEKELIEHYQEHKKLVEKILSSASRSMEKTNQEYIDAILSNYKYSDQVVRDKSLKGILRRLFQEPDKEV